MSEAIVIVCEGRQYEWTIDPDAAPERACTWIDPKTFMAPPSAVAQQLNREFIEQVAPSYLTNPNLHVLGLREFAAMLRAMGATIRDFERPGLELILAYDNPKRFRERRFEQLPPAAHDPFNCQEIRDWAFSDPAKLETPNSVICIGHGPFAEDDYDRFLTFRGVQSLRLNGAAPIVGGHLVLGREGWEEDVVDEAIDFHQSRTLRVYSQEMFTLVLSFGLDPFLAPPDVLAAFRAGHPGLEFVSEGWTGWVQTYVDSEWRTGGNFSNTAGTWPEESPLKLLGYTVGRKGLSLIGRQEILTKAFKGELPRVDPPICMDEWGEPGSAARLHKIAKHIAAVCRNAKARRSPPEEAIEDWRTDLQWLRDTFYHGHIRFQWPDTNA